MTQPTDQRCSIRDLIYFDFDRAASIYSQIGEGLLKEVQSQVETSADQRNVRKYDLKLFKPEFGGIASEKTSQIESKIVHHDVLARIEEALFGADMAVDVNKSAVSAQNYDTIRSAVSERSYIRVEGWAAVEDYRRVTAFADKFKTLARFIGMCHLLNEENEVQNAAILKALEDARRRVESAVNKNKRDQAQAQLRKAEEKVSEAVDQLFSTSEVPDWLVDGLGMFVDTFLPNHLNVRVCPFESLPAFQVIAGLKRDCLVDGDLETFAFAYGAKPNVKLSLFGLVTSLPTKGGSPFDFEQEYGENVGAPEDVMAFQRGFRGLFNGFESFERFVRFSRYPNITIQPIAVYRDIHATGDQ